MCLDKKIYLCGLCLSEPPSPTSVVYLMNDECIFPLHIWVNLTDQLIRRNMDIL